MKRASFAGMLLLLLQWASACDVCGCGTGFQGIGFIPGSQFHFVGIGYQNDRYQSIHPVLFEDEEEGGSLDRYQSLTIMGRYVIDSKWQVFGYLPLQHKTIKSDQEYQLTGLGDAQAYVNYKLAGNDDLTLYGAAGFRLPTGRSGVMTQGVLIPNLQLGNGSFDGLTMVNFTYRGERFGLNAELNGSVRLFSTNDYLFGNRADATALGFAYFQRPKVSLLPQAGVKVITAMPDRERGLQGTVDFTGGHYLYVPLAFDVYFERWGIRSRVDVPIAGSLSDGYVTPEPGFKVQVLYKIEKNNNEKKKTDTRPTLDLGGGSHDLM